MRLFVVRIINNVAFTRLLKLLSDVNIYHIVRDGCWVMLICITLSVMAAEWCWYVSHCPWWLHQWCWFYQYLVMSIFILKMGVGQKLVRNCSVMLICITLSVMAAPWIQCNQILFQYLLENGCWTETGAELLIVVLWTDYVERKEGEIVKSMASDVAGAMFKIFDIFCCWSLEAMLYIMVETSNIFVTGQFHDMARVAMSRSVAVLLFRAEWLKHFDRLVAEWPWPKMDSVCLRNSPNLFLPKSVTRKQLINPYGTPVTPCFIYWWVKSSVENGLMDFRQNMFYFPAKPSTRDNFDSFPGQSTIRPRKPQESVRSVGFMVRIRFDEDLWDLWLGLGYLTKICGIYG